MNSARKTLLVLTYYFPPAGGPGVQRVLKFVKYLPEFGWEPVVITVDGGDFPAYDASLTEEVPETVPVLRVPALEPYSLYRKFTGKSKEEHIPVGTLAKKDKSNGFAEKISRWIRANLFVPDARIGWIVPVIRKGFQTASQYKIDALLCSSPPHSVQLAACHLAKKLSIPWIVDFRDPWTDIYYYQELNRNKLAQQIDAYFERKVSNTADGVLTVSPSLVGKIRKRAPQQQVTLIPNGYDATDFSEGTHHLYDRFSLSYIGNLKANQNPSVLWSVLKRLIENTSGFQENFLLHLTGKIHPQVMASLEKYGLTNYTKIDKYVPHAEATKRMQSAAVLLFVVPDAADNQGILTGKLFEYLAAERPVFSIGPPDGDAAQILRDADAGTMMDYQDQSGITEMLKKLYIQWEKEDMKESLPNKEQVQQFERREQSRILSTLLNDKVNTAN